ncbi:hypothetical protein CPB84DRAFT_1782618 [Gymnopilus junonius]|uniref:DUF1279 domain-containing protein n=1 Tax=Gymnopilus junonius TaxID=109634 RepID=A0A9P5NI93_GYMJU|nr:hypothetical protein CPB84DRAFT_1782618 [Gymnopilus junonius]
MRGFLPRLHVLRAFAPRIRSPILPTTRFGSSPRAPRIRLFAHSPARHTSTPPTPSLDPKNTLPPNASLSQRLKHLIKSYGWYALGVYIIIGTLDFGVAFVGINLLGAEYVSQVAASVKSMVGSVWQSRAPEPGRDEIESMNNPGAKTGHEGLYAMLVLAYTIHKTLFLPVRVGLTAAFTPRLVSWLARRGWTGRGGVRRAGQEMRERIRERQTRQ